MAYGTRRSNAAFTRVFQLVQKIRSVLWLKHLSYSITENKNVSRPAFNFTEEIGRNNGTVVTELRTIRSWHS